MSQDRIGDAGEAWTGTATKPAVKTQKPLLVISLVGAAMLLWIFVDYLRLEAYPTAKSGAAAVLSIDVKPQSAPNRLDVNHRGALPVAILGSAQFDVEAIDPSSVRLLEVAPISSGFADVAMPEDPLETAASDSLSRDDGLDGHADLALEFDAQAVLQALGESLGRPLTHGEQVVLQVTGKLREEYGSYLFQGSDVVVMSHAPVGE